MEMGDEDGAFCVVVLCGRAEGRKIEKDLLRIFLLPEKTRSVIVFARVIPVNIGKRSRMEKPDLYLVRPRLGDNFYAGSLFGQTSTWR